MTYVKMDICILAIVLVPTALFLGYMNLSALSQKFLKPSLKAEGAYIAEVWLEWSICRGSTMYRQRFSSKWRAYVAAKFHAMILDHSLPKHYWVEGRDGRRLREEYEMGINFGVRNFAQGEQPYAFFTATMPGHSGYEGEHREAHPLLEKMRALQGSVDGFLI